MKKSRIAVLLLSAAVLAACVSAPTAPSVMALPGRDKQFDQFMVDDSACRKFAAYQVGAPKEGENAGAATVTLATIVGAVAGAAIGGRDGAAVGAGMGLVAGSAMGSEQARAARYGTQRQYDQAYIQCMYARGHKVPVQGVMTESQATASSGTQAPPPPPPGMPPPPPPGVSSPPGR
ncbi:MAG TPA: hypothetical protein PLW86_11155 [Rhodocyclaceae bacterium]|nr:hypothetical protein [Rhodocyclaceae bacterium]